MGGTFEELLERVAKCVQDALANAAVPFHKVEEAVRRLEAASGVDVDTRSPILQAMLVYEDEDSAAEVDPLLLAPSVSQQLHGRDCIRPNDDLDPKFELSLVVRTVPAGTMSCMIEYSTDLFQLDTIARLAEHMCVLLGSAADAPHTSVQGSKVHARNFCLGRGFLVYLCQTLNFGFVIWLPGPQAE